MRLSLCLCACLAFPNPIMLAQETSPSSSSPKVLYGTEELNTDKDIASELVDNVDRYLLKQLDASVNQRMQAWPKPDGQPATAHAYREKTDVLRQELRSRIGMVDARSPCEAFEMAGNAPAPGSANTWITRSESATTYAIRWRVFEGVDGYGLMVLPVGEVAFSAVLIPDAGQSPEQLLDVGEYLASRNGIVIIPDTIRRYREARNGRAKMTDQEYLYRSAFVLGRHTLGYQVHEVSAAVDVLERTYTGKPTLVGGWGEGGMLSLYAAAVDERIQAACVSGHFGPREKMWSEPIHRNIQGLLNRFGDAQLAALIAPRSLVIDAIPGPSFDIPGEGGAPSLLSGPTPEATKAEVDRTLALLKPWGLQNAVQIVKPENITAGNVPSIASLDLALSALKIKPISPASRTSQPTRPTEKRLEALPTEESRRRNTLAKWDRFNQGVLERSATERDQFWGKLDTSTPEKFQETVKPYLEYFRTETIGDWQWEAAPPKPRTRLIYDEPNWSGYEVVLDVHDEVFAYGVLLIPRDGKPLAHRPCVVFQHGLEGRPKDTIVGDHPAYHDVSRQLVEQRYVVFAPQNLYLFQDRFRTLQRKSNPLGKTLFSTIVAQHRQIVRWLASRDEVDPKRIAFYGLSYGGKSAMRIPALVPEYCLSICSADFNDWVWKNASTNSPYSYVWTNEYEIFEYGLGNHFNYAEMAALIAPRPFMVERGHFDNVAPDERVAYEFAKVNRLYSAKLGLADRCKIEWFVGPHTINGKGTFQFLSEHLKQ